MAAIFVLASFKLLRYLTAPADYLDARATLFQIFKNLI